ncbi:MAG: hypothetical protein D6732_25970 [Methanobacteriota archaeon]|nr:MAG: hypothetical protein D6732_25970 [Euryarchaeota archaeon]
MIMMSNGIQSNNFPYPPIPFLPRTSLVSCSALEKIPHCCKRFITFFFYKLMRFYRFSAMMIMMILGMPMFGIDILTITEVTC